MSKKFYFAIVVLLACNLFSSEETFSINLNDRVRTFTVSLAEQDFKHIVDGHPTQDGFSGGHDWNRYYESYVRNDEFANVYFDIGFKTYIVSSIRAIVC